MLTSRQLAVVLWLAIFAAWALTVEGVRASLGSVLRTLFSPKLLLLFSLVIGSLVAAVWLLWREGHWDVSMLYDTVLFVAVGGIGSVSRAASQGATYDWRFFSKTVLVNLEIMVVATFLIDFYPLNFWIEFLVVIPVVTLVAMLVVFSEYQKDAAQVHSFLTSIQGIIGLSLLGYVLWQALKSPGPLLQSQAVLSLALPFVLSVLFMPVLILICAVFAYESAFLVVSFKGEDQPQLTRWKKRRLLLRFGLNLPALQAFRRSPVIHDFAWVKTKDEALARLAAWRSGTDEDGWYSQGVQ